MINYPEKDIYTYDDLVDILRILRAPGGCPWDREQTHQSNRRNFLEEAYEAAEAFDLDDPELMKEELGDVLMQVVLLSQIAREKGLFDITDVIKGISEKMIRRHPHVFGTPGTEVPDWEAIKQQEKQQRSRELEQAEKAAFRAAAGQIICHLSER